MALGRTYVKAGRKDEAARAFSRIVDEFPQSAYAADARREVACVRERSIRDRHRFDVGVAQVLRDQLDHVAGAEQQLVMWNLHILARAGLTGSIDLLPSDVVFTEPPRP